MNEFENREIKARAKEKLSHYWIPAAVVCLLWSILTQTSAVQVQAGEQTKLEMAAEALGNLSPVMFLGFLAAAALGTVIVGIIVLLIRIFLLSVLEVGKNRFFLECRVLERSAGIGRLFWVFGCGYYLNVVKTIFLRDLKVTLWSLLLVIPGIYKSYEYAMIAYLLAENPDASSRELFAASRQLMDGRKFQLFCLEMSFLLWYVIPGLAVTLFNPFLGILVILVMGFFIDPYLAASEAEFYTELRREADESGGILQ